jgi:hypothetical protein
LSFEYYLWYARIVTIITISQAYLPHCVTHGLKLVYIHHKLHESGHSEPSLGHPTEKSIYSPYAYIYSHPAAAINYTCMRRYKLYCTKEETKSMVWCQSIHTLGGVTSSRAVTNVKPMIHSLMKNFFPFRIHYPRVGKSLFVRGHHSVQLAPGERTLVWLDWRKIRPSGGGLGSRLGLAEPGR